MQRNHSNLPIWTMSDGVGCKRDFPKEGKLSFDFRSNNSPDDGANVLGSHKKMSSRENMGRQKSVDFDLEKNLDEKSPLMHMRTASAETKSLLDFDADGNADDVGSNMERKRLSKEEKIYVTVTKQGDSSDQLQQTRQGHQKPFTSPQDDALASFLGVRSLWNDVRNFNSHSGSIPQSVVIGMGIAATCGVASFLYYTALFALLEWVWHTIPDDHIVGVWPDWAYICWIPIVVLCMGICVGLSVRFLGEPGDLAFTIQCVHEKACVELDHVLPMLVASQFSIVGGGSLGPEAPLVAICAALSGFISRNIFRQNDRNVIRKHTLMGMAGALSAFFGAPLGGSLFALEVCSKFGVEYFEHLIEAIFVGVMTLAVFRTLARLPMEAMWQISPTELEGARVDDLIVGAFIGILAAVAGIIFTYGHWGLISLLDRFGLLQNRFAVRRALIGATVIATIGIFIPHTLFWGEKEFQTIATAAPASSLPHVFPTRGATAFEIDSCLHAFLVGIMKLVAISFTVAGGYRGGFIFPLFAAGAAFGRALVYVFPSISPVIACLCFAAGMNVAITKTSLATPLILIFLSGEEYALPAVLTASLVSLFATSYMPFIKTQTAREDIDQSLIPRYPPLVEEEEASILSSVSFHRRRPPLKRTTLFFDVPAETDALGGVDRLPSFLTEPSFGERRESLHLDHRCSELSSHGAGDSARFASLRRNQPSLHSMSQRGYIV